MTTMRRTGLLAGVLGLALVLTAGPRASHAQAFVSGGIGGPGWGISGGVVSPGAVVAPAPIVAVPPVIGYSAWGYPAYGGVVGYPVVRPVAPIYRYPAWGVGYGRYGYRRGWR
jgi:hypothetical protein